MIQLKNDLAPPVILPHHSLQKYICFYNILLPEPDMFKEQYTIMPEGTGTLSLAFDGNTIQTEMWGTSVTPTQLGCEPGQYQVLLLIQFTPFGLYQITRQNQTDFTNQRLPLIDIDPKLYRALHHAFAASSTRAHLVRACDRIFSERLSRQYVSDALLSACQSIRECHGQVPVGQLAQMTGYSERHLNRLFQSQIGVSMKEYTRLVRFNYVLRHLPRSTGALAALSQQAGYFDQAHFDKDFKAISGVSPQRYLKNMSDFYYDTDHPLDILSV